MAKSSIEKTNVMRLLDQKKVPYTPHTYPHGDDAVDGVTVAQMTGMDPAKVFKTLGCPRREQDAVRVRHSGRV